MVENPLLAWRFRGRHNWKALGDEAGRAVHELGVAGVRPQVDRAERLRLLAALVPCRVHLDPGVTRGVDRFGLGRPADGWSEGPDAEEIIARGNRLDPEGAVASDRSIVA